MGTAENRKVEILRLYVRTLILLFCLSIACAACAPDAQPVGESEMAGTWICKGPEGKQANLELRPDGTISGSGLPDRVFYSTFSDKFGGPPDWSVDDSINGTWKTDWHESIRQASVKVTIDGRITGSRFVIERENDVFVLKYHVGDPDSPVFLKFERSS